MENFKQAKNGIGLGTELFLSDTRRIPITENNESIVDLGIISQRIKCKPGQNDMYQYVGDKVYVRKSLGDMMVKAVDFLPDGYSFNIVYGLRFSIIQKEYFIERFNSIYEQNKSLSIKELTQLTHQYTASPICAGHPTGGAIDLTILDSNGTELDMGTPISPFKPKEVFIKYKDFNTDAF